MYLVQAWIGNWQELNPYLGVEFPEYKKKFIQLSESIIHWLIIDRLLFGPINPFFILFEHIVNLKQGINGIRKILYFL